MSILNEEQKLYIYQDVETGKSYLYDGWKLVEIPGDAEDSDTGEKSKGSSDAPPDETKDEETPEKSEAGEAGEGETSDGEEGESKGDSTDSSSDAESDKESEGNSSESSSEGSSEDEGSDSSSGKETEGTPQSGAENSDSDTTASENSEEAERGDGKPKTDISDDIDWEHLADEWDNLSDKQKKDIRDQLDQVDEDVLEQEEKEREEQIEKEMAEYDASELDNSEEEKARLEEIGQLLKDESSYRQIMDETDRVVYADRRKVNAEKKAAEKEAQKYTASKGIDEFVIDINKLIGSEVKKIKKSSWGRINKKADGSGIMKPGKMQKKNPDIPTLYVYFDQSGSWGSSDIKIGEQAVSTLNTFVEKKQLKIELYYFGERLTTTPGQSANGPMWECFDKVAEHIKQHKPDNVMIMTDSDGDYYDYRTHINSMSPLTIKGGMFLLFRRGDVSKQVVRVFHGKALTKIYKF